MQNSQKKNITIALVLYIVIWPKDITKASYVDYANLYQRVGLKHVNPLAPNSCDDFIFCIILTCV